MADLYPRRIGPVLLTAVLLMSAGCDSPPAPRTGDRGPIVFVDGPDTSSDEQLKQLVNAWNDMHGYSEQVTFLEMPYPTNQHRAQLRARAQTPAHSDRPNHRSQCYDVITMDVIWTAEFAKAGYIVPLDPAEFQVDALLDRPVKAVTLDGKLWAVPHRTDAGLLFYRKDLLDRAGLKPPTSWDELARQARMIGAEEHIDGLVGQYDHYEGLTVNAIEAIWGHGGDVVGPGGKVVVDSPEAKAALRMLAEAVGSDASGWIPRSALGYNEEKSRAWFQQGSAVFLRNWPYVFKLLGDPKSPVLGKFDVAELPGPSALGGWNLGISSCSEHQETAREFIKFITSETNQRRLFEQAGFAPTIAKLYQDPELRQRFPYLDVLQRSIERSRDRPVTRYYDDVSGAIQEYVSTALAQPERTDAMIDDLARKLTTVLSRK